MFEHRRSCAVVIDANFGVEHHHGHVWYVLRSMGLPAVAGQTRRRPERLRSFFHADDLELWVVTLTA